MSIMSFAYICVLHLWCIMHFYLYVYLCLMLHMCMCLCLMLHMCMYLCLMLHMCMYLCVCVNIESIRGLWLATGGENSSSGSHNHYLRHRNRKTKKYKSTVSRRHLCPQVVDKCWFSNGNLSPLLPGACISTFTCLHVQWQPIISFTFTFHNTLLVSMLSGNPLTLSLSIMHCSFTFTFHNALLVSTSSGNLLSPPTFSSFCHCPIWTITQHSYFFCKKYFLRHLLFFTFSIFFFHPMPSFPESLTVQRPVHFNQTCHIRHHSNTFPANSNQKNEGKRFTDNVWMWSYFCAFLPSKSNASKGFQLLQD